MDASYCWLGSVLSAYMDCFTYFHNTLPYSINVKVLNIKLNII